MWRKESISIFSCKQWEPIIELLLKFINKLAQRKMNLCKKKTHKLNGDFSSDILTNGRKIILKLTKSRFFTSWVVEMYFLSCKDRHDKIL